MDIKYAVGFVICKYWYTWWLDCILGVEGDKVKINFLKPHGPSPSFKYLQFPDILVMHKSEVLTKVDATTSAGRVNQLTEFETQTAKKAITLKIKKETMRGNRSTEC